MFCVERKHKTSDKLVGKKFNIVLGNICCKLCEEEAHNSRHLISLW
uniref:Uncharacterized protein n=1 Tax=Triticum urartu TaxID=4572 RepID=A0A8R7UCB2_TRIUA